MAKALSFHIDESVPHFTAVARGLRPRGIDVTTGVESGLLGAKDLAHLAFSAAQGRVLFTNDPDFLAHAAAGASHAGIIYCEQDKHTIGQLI